MTNAEYILEFINSYSVYKHLIDIGYEPDSLTAAFIVWQSKDHHTLEEKEKAYNFIIENMPDMPIPAHEYHGAKESVHEFLREYMSTLSGYIKRFQLNTDRAVYDFSAFYGAPDNQWIHDDNLYSSYEKVIDAATQFTFDDYDNFIESTPVLFRIRRRELDFESGSDYLYLTPNLEPYKLCMDTIMPDEDHEVLHLFENLCLPIPHPFKKGDIIRECAGKYALPTYYNDTLVVTDYMSEDSIKEKYSTLCMHDYTLYGICSDGEGSYEDSINHYLYAELVNPGDVLIKDWILLEKSDELKNIK